MVISSRTPEGSPNRCPVCGAAIPIEPSDPGGDAPCPRCGHLLWFTWEDMGDAIVITPTGAVLASEELDTLIENALENRGAHLVLDFGNVQFLPSAALGKLINLKMKYGGVKGRLTIENLHPDLLEVFRITRLDQVFDVRR
jgi:anti-sigma B factor antagonist